MATEGKGFLRSGMLADIIGVKISRMFGMAPRRFPFLGIFVTKNCNLNCGFCYQSKTGIKKEQRELSSKEWARVLDSAKRIGCKVIIITGGEPFTRKDIFDIIRKVKENGMSPHMCSNGCLLDRRMIEKLKRWPPVSISFSMDGPSEKSHDAIRGKGSFEKTVRAIKILKREIPSIKVRLNFVINKMNFGQMRYMPALAKRIGADQVFVLPIHNNLRMGGKERGGFKSLMLGREDIEPLRRELAVFREEVKRNGIESGSDSFLEGIINFFLGKKRGKCCYSGFASCVVDPYGFVSPCEDIAGEESVRDKPLEEIWRSSSFHRLRKRVMACRTNCWDTTHAELNIRLSIGGAVREFRRILREIGFYKV